MPEVQPVVYLIVGVVLVNGIAGRIRMPAPILLVIAGVAASFIPGVPDYRGQSRTGAVRADPAVAVRSRRRRIGGRHPDDAPARSPNWRSAWCVVTAFAVAIVVTAIVPDMPFAAALALGAIVAPPDAVAAVAVARRAGLPRKVVTLLEGESLFNDATSLVLLRVAVVGISLGSMSWGDAVAEFAWATVGGILVGGVLGVLLSAAGVTPGRRWRPLRCRWSTPFLAYQVGELVDASGHARRRRCRAGAGIPCAVRPATGGAADPARHLECDPVRAGGIGVRADRTAAVEHRHRTRHRPPTRPDDLVRGAAHRHPHPADLDLPDRRRSADCSADPARSPRGGRWSRSPGPACVGWSRWPPRRPCRWTRPSGRSCSPARSPSSWAHWWSRGSPYRGDQRAAPAGGSRFRSAAGTGRRPGRGQPGDQRSRRTNHLGGAVVRGGGRPHAGVGDFPRLASADRTARPDRPGPLERRRPRPARPDRARNRDLVRIERDVFVRMRNSGRHLRGGAA